MQATKLRGLSVACVAVMVLVAPGGARGDHEGAHCEHCVPNPCVLTWADGRRFDGRYGCKGSRMWGVLTWKDGASFEGELWGGVAYGWPSVYTLNRPGNPGG